MGRSAIKAASWTAALFLLLCFSVYSRADTPVKVGAYQNEPKIFIDDKGLVKGIFPEILEDIAAKEGWSLRYVQGTWEDCLARLERGEIDLTPDVAYSEERAQRFDFTSETVLNNWSRIYTPKGSEIQSVLDLDGKSVAVLKGSFQAGVIEPRLRQFGVSISLVEFDSYAGELQAIEAGEVDAGVVTRLYGLQSASQYDVQATAIIVAPAELRFAVPKGKNAFLTEAIDRHVREMMADDGSVYYQAFHRWLAPAQPSKLEIPQWLWRTLIGGAAIVLLLLALNQILRIRVNAATRELRKRTDQLSREITEREQADKALRESEERYRELAESISDVFFALNEDFRYIYWNRGSEELTGIPREEALGKSLYDIFPEFAGTKADEFYRRVMHTKTPGTFENEFELHGRKHVFELSAYPTKTGLAVYVKDITERKQAKDALRESEKRYRTIFDNTGTAMAIIEEDTTISLANDEFAKLSGYSREETEGKIKWTEFVVPEDLERMVGYHRERRKNDGGAPTQYEFRFINRDGGIRNILLNVSIIPGTGKSVASLLDITERKRAEEDIQRFKAAVESSTDAVGMSTQDGEHFYQNAAFTRMFGDVGKDPPSSVYVDEGVGREVFDTITKGEEWTGEVEMYGKDKNVLYVFLRAYPVKKEGRIIAVAGVHADITERKQAEERLRLLSSVAEQAGDGLAVADTDGHIIYANRAWAGMHGYESEELIGKHLRVFHNEKQLKEDVEPFNKQALLKGHHEGEVGHVRKDGSEFPTHMTTTLLKDEEGKIKGLIGSARDISEWKRAEQAVRESEERYRLLVESIPQKIFLKDANSVYVSCNENFAQDLGITAEEFGGKTDHDFFPKELAKKYIADDRRVMESGETEEIEERYVRGGKELIVHTVKTPVRDEADNTIGVLGVFSDITERKRAEARIRREAERTKLLLEMHIRAPELSDKELYDYVLDKAVELTDSAIGFFHLVGDDQKTIALTTWNSKALKSCSASYDAHYPIAKAGNWVDCVRLKKPVVYNDFADAPNRKGFPEGHVPIERFMSVPVSDGEKVRFIFGVGNKPDDYTEYDVTQIQLVANELHKIIINRRAEEALRESQSKMDAMLRSISDHMSMMDSDLNIVWANETAMRLFGDDVVGKKCYTAYHGRDKPCEPYPCIVLQSFEDGKVHEHDTQVVDKEERTLYFHCTSNVALRDEKGEPIAVIEVSRDVTEARQLQEQLLQAQKMEAIGRLAGGVAHDFNNLLTVIMGYTEMLLHHLEDERLKTHAEAVAHAAQKAETLTGQLLAFSRKQIRAPKVLNVNDIVKETDKMLRRMIGEDIEMVTVLQPDLSHVQIDPGQIEQVIMNLAINARDAMPEGGKLTIETANVELDADYAETHMSAHPGPHVMLAMTDTGCGMDKETQNQVFEPFFTTKQVGAGTGLGLSTVYGVVKQNRGNIWVYSEPGKGTTFKIYLPVAEEKAPSARPPKPKPEAKGGAETILVVEDEEIIRELAREVLEQKGYNVLTARHGAEALMASEQHDRPINLLLTDVIMPEMSGKELAERLLALRGELKVTYMSGYADAAVFQNGKIPDAASYLQKPFTPGGLLRKVREVLDETD